MAKVEIDDRPSGAVKSADRVLTLLEYLAEVKHAPFAAIVRDLGLPNSSCHQLLQTVTARGFIEFDEATRTFRLGSRLWEVAQSYTMAEDLAAIAQPLMDDLRDHTTETVQLARLDGLENVYLAISESPHPMKLVSAVGSRLSAHATGLGKVLLAEPGTGRAGTASGHRRTHPLHRANHHHAQGSPHGSGRDTGAWFR